MNMQEQLDLLAGAPVHSRQLEIMAAIARERKFQDQKHGHPRDNPHSIGAWLLTIEQELDEAKRACTKGGEGRDNVVSEIVQIAALCVACLEQWGINPIPGRTV